MYSLIDVMAQIFSAGFKGVMLKIEKQIFVWKLQKSELSYWVFK